MTDDAVQNHRLDAIERRLDKHDEILNKLAEAQVRQSEQQAIMSTEIANLADLQRDTQDILNGVVRSMVKWMMGLGSAIITAILGGQLFM